MDKSYIDTQHVIDRYVQGKLHGDELAQFEIHMLEHPEILHDIELARGMQSAMNSASTELQATGKRRETRPLLLAASLLATIGIVFSIWLLQPAGVPDSPETTPPAQLDIWLEQTRGQPGTTITAGKHERIRLHIDAGPRRYAAYTAELHSLSPDRSILRTGLQPDSDQVLHVTLPLTATGDYALSVHGIDAERRIPVITDWPITVERR